MQSLINYTVLLQEDKSYSFRFHIRHVSTIIFCTVTIVHSIFYWFITFGILCSIVDFAPGTYQIELRVLKILALCLSCNHMKTKCILQVD